MPDRLGGPVYVCYSVWAYRVGPPQHESISAAAFQGADTDAPALLLLCDSVEDRDQLRRRLQEMLHVPTT